MHRCYHRYEQHQNTPGGFSLDARSSRIKIIQPVEQMGPQMGPAIICAVFLRPLGSSGGRPCITSVSANTTARGGFTN